MLLQQHGIKLVHVFVTTNKIFSKPIKVFNENNVKLTLFTLLCYCNVRTLITVMFSESSVCTTVDICTTILLTPEHKWLTLQVDIAI
jgi:hypothetical protein